MFGELVNSYFAGNLALDYNKLGRVSLLQFFTAVLEQQEAMDNQLYSLLPTLQHRNFLMNGIPLLLEASRIIPGFRKQYAMMQRNELSAWRRTIRAAKKAREIRTGISVDQLARLFMNLGAGTSISEIPVAKKSNKINELRVLWHALYNALKL